MTGTVIYCCRFIYNSDVGGFADEEGVDQRLKSEMQYGSKAHDKEIIEKRIRGGNV